jgi:hypothetical protein
MRLVVMGKDGQEAILEEGSASYEGYLQMGYVFVREYQPQGEAGDAVEATEAATEPTTPEEPVTAPVTTAPAQDTETKAAEAKATEAKATAAKDKA